MTTPYDCAMLGCATDPETEIYDDMLGGCLPVCRHHCDYFTTKDPERWNEA